MIAPRRLKLTHTAERDLASIYRYIAQENRAAAEKQLRDLSAKLFELATNGISGASREWIAAGLRMHPIKPYCVYFRIIEGEMRVMRVLHGRQDVAAEFFTP